MDIFLPELIYFCLNGYTFAQMDIIWYIWSYVGIHMRIIVHLSIYMNIWYMLIHVDILVYYGILFDIKLFLINFGPEIDVLMLLKSAHMDMLL